MPNEKLLNNYYNKGGYNRPQLIGYMMQMIRNLNPLTEEEWKIWYFENVHNQAYLYKLAEKMHQDIPANYGITKNECISYIYDVMFHRTFQGYNKEKSALKLLRKEISPDVQEAPKEWDTEYFIDFYVKGADGNPIGIQLKPETFYRGNYQNVVDIQGKMNSFCQAYNTQAFVLTYKNNTAINTVEFTNPEVIDQIKKACGI